MILKCAQWLIYIFFLYQVDFSPPPKMAPRDVPFPLSPLSPGMSLWFIADWSSISEVTVQEDEESYPNTELKIN